MLNIMIDILIKAVVFIYPKIRSTRLIEGKSHQKSEKSIQRAK